MRLDVHTISLTVKPAPGRASVSGWFTLRLWLVVNLFTLLRTARRAIEVAQEAEEHFRVVSLALSTSVRQPRKLKRRIHKSKKRFRVVACGRHYGKTLMACNELARFALENQNSNCAWVAPYFKQSRIAYRLIRKAFAKSGNEIITHKSDTELRLELANGSVIQFFSAENHDSIRGDGYHFIVIDEAGDALKDPKVWTDTIRPALSDTNGRALIIGTPKGRNLFFQLFARGADPEYPDWESFTAPTADNPYIPASEIRAAKAELPEDTFNQEYLAVFLEESAGVFRGVDLAPPLLKKSTAIIQTAAIVFRD